MMPDVDRIRSALGFIPANDRDTWVKMGMAVKSELGDDGHSLWEEWSESDQSYDPKAAKDVWRSIRANGKTTIASLYREAKARGWRDDAAQHEPTSEEIAERRRIAAERAAVEEAKDLRIKTEARERAALIWHVATPAPDTHPYLARKGIRAHGAHLYHGDLVIGGMPCDGALIIPVREGEDLHSLQFISADGDKRFLTGGRVRGCSYLIGTPGDGLAVAEGFADAASIHEATGCATAVAFDAGNLALVARALRKAHQDQRVTLCADNDLADGRPNVGVEAAIKAARAVGGCVAVPELGGRKCDFNDLFRECGPKAVKQAIEAARKLGTDRDAVTLNTDVTGVTDVQASNGADFAVTPTFPVDVTDVTSEVEVIPAADKRPAFKVFDDWTKEPKLRAGVWFFGVRPAKRPDDPPTLTQQWVCSPVHIDAVSFDGQDNNFGRLLRFKNTLGRWREWAMPMDLLRGSGDDLRGELLAMGVEIDPLAKNLLGQFLQSQHPKRRVRCALQVGWCGDSFVLPDVVIGPKASGVIFQSGERGHDEHTVGGTLAGWQSEIAARAVGNPLLILALSASFAGPMLSRCNGESGGVHFVGDSSTGKTTANDAACATWGGTNYRRSWRATANGMEGAAAMFNDCLLVLDEIGECDPKEVGAIVYALGNGRGKQRASRTGNARSVTRWRCFVLSSGERTIATTMADGGYRAKAGQSVRLLDIPASRRFGAFDNLHGLPNGAAFADAIRLSAIAHHGHAGRAFLERLTRDSRDFCQLLERFKALPMFSADGGEGQVKRTAGRFALMALAGEVATEYGITTWAEGAATEAVAEIFTTWQSTRGRGNDERRQILEQVSGFIERHGDSRFSNADGAPDDAMRINRAGWWREDGSGRVYLFNAEGMREAVKGFDFKRALSVLQESGALPKADGERAKVQRIDRRLVRLYPIQADKLEADHGA